MSNTPILDMIRKMAAKEGVALPELPKEKPEHYCSPNCDGGGLHCLSCWKVQTS